MSLLVCKDCSTRYAPDVDACPHCSSTERVEDGGRGPLLPFLDVACAATSICPVAGVTRRVHLRAAAPGVVERPVLLCTRCGSAMQVVRSWQDQSTDSQSELEENSMPKITVHGGPSNADAEPDAVEMVQQAPAEGEPEEIQGDDGGLALPDADEAEEREAPGIQRPARSAPKPEWVGFAKAINEREVVDERDPESLTKAQLIDLYGELGEE